MAVRLRHTSRMTFSGLTACKAHTTDHGLSIGLGAPLPKDCALLKHTYNITVSSLSTSRGVLHSGLIKGGVHLSQGADM